MEMDVCINNIAGQRTKCWYTAPRFNAVRVEISADNSVLTIPGFSSSKRHGHTNNPYRNHDNEKYDPTKNRNRKKKARNNNYSKEQHTKAYPALQHEPQASNQEVDCSIEQWITCFDLYKNAGLLCLLLLNLLIRSWRRW